MSETDYITAVLLVALTTASFAVGAVAVRARLLPGWSGAPARLAEIVLWIAGVVAVNQALGAVGALRIMPEVLIALAIGAAGLLDLRRPRAASSHPAPPAPPVRDLPAAWLAGAATAAVAAGWIARVRESLAHGMPSVDTLWYHMPFAARFAEDGSVHALSLTQPDPLTLFYPANAELLHGLGILLVERDTLSPLLNLGWLGLALLAAWCIGRPFGVSAGTLLAADIVAGSYIMTWSQPGEASNDIVAVALFLASIALVVNAASDPRGLAGDARGLALAALPAAVAFGTKVSMIAPVLVLFVAVLVHAGPQVRRRLAVAWLAALLTVGGVWYLRNLVVAGNPVPAVELGVGDVDLPTIHADPALESPEIGFDSTLAHLLTEPGAGDIITGGLRADFGPAWWAILAAAGVALLASAATRQGGLTRLLGITGLLAAAAYVVTPQSGVSFTVNVRHLLPALALGLVLLPLVPRLRDTPLARRGCLALLAVLFVTAQTEDGLPPWDHPGASLAVVAAIAAGAGLVAVARRRPSPRPLLAGGAAVLAACAVVTGYYVQRDYLDDRYADPSRSLISGAQPDRPLLEVYAWARDVRDATIGLKGTQLQYPLFGLDLSNRVRYLHESEDHGRVIRRIPSCERWREALVALAPDFVVVTPVRFPFNERPAEPEEARWTRSLAGAEQIASHGGQVFVFRVGRLPGSGGCGR